MKLHIHHPFVLLLNRFMNLKITWKILLIYLTVILIPTSLLLTYFYQMNKKSMTQSYYESQQNMILSAKETLSTQMSQITANYYYFQQSDSLSELLNGVYPDTSTTLFYYMKDIRPLIKNSKLNNFIKNVGIYGYKEYPLNMKYGLGSVEMLDRDEAFLSKLPSNNGFWEISRENNDVTIRYYRQIYTNHYPYNRGVLVFYMDAENFFKNFYAQVKRPFYFSCSNGSFISYNDGNYLFYDTLPAVLRDEKNKILSLQFPENCPVMEIPVFPLEYLERQNSFFSVGLVFLILLFSLFYFLMNRSLYQRLTGFTRHLQNASADELLPFETVAYKDEIGIAINAYNDMLSRTNHLIHENLKIRIQKQNSDYYALQAQIKPHFLYNILENIRMNAEIAGDSDTADMLLLLGRHMRYNLNMSCHPLLFQDELYAAKTYLQIHDIRIKGKIHYEISVSTELDDVWCPRFILQPLLENAIQHGYSIEHSLFIKITVTDSENMLYPNSVQVIIQDNGNGISSKQLTEFQKKIKAKTMEEDQHVGLLNVNARLSSFLKSPEGCLDISSSPNKGTSVIFYLKRGKEYAYFDCGR